MQYRSPGLAGAVGEHVTEVAAARGAVDLDPVHPVAEVVDAARRWPGPPAR